MAEEWIKIETTSPKEGAQVISDRLAVPGGWVIRTIVVVHGTGVGVHQVFVSNSVLKPEWIVAP